MSRRRCLVWCRSGRQGREEEDRGVKSRSTLRAFRAGGGQPTLGHKSAFYLNHALDPTPHVSLEWRLSLNHALDPNLHCYAEHHYAGSSALRGTGSTMQDFLRYPFRRICARREVHGQPPIGKMPPETRRRISNTQLFRPSGSTQNSRQFFICVFPHFCGAIFPFAAKHTTHTKRHENNKYHPTCGYLLTFQKPPLSL